MASLKQADLGPVKSGQEAEFFLTYFCATPAGPKVVAEPNRNRVSRIISSGGLVNAITGA